MLTVMCPNCLHEFPALEPSNTGESAVLGRSVGDQFLTSCGESYCTGGNYLMRGGYLSSGSGGGSCMINAPTIIHNPTIINGHIPNDFTKWIQHSGRNTGGPHLPTLDTGISPHCQIYTTESHHPGIMTERQHWEEPNFQQGIFQNPHPMLFPAPSGCRELPGARVIQHGSFPDPTSVPTAFNFNVTEEADWTRTRTVTWPTNTVSTYNTNFNNIVPNSDGIFANMTNVISDVNNHQGPHSSAGTVIQVNATLQLPPNVAHCTVNITATSNANPPCNRARNNFNGGGIIEPDNFIHSGASSLSSITSNYSERDENSPTTPISWVLPFPWGVNGNTGNNITDLERLSAAQRVLQISGWYHEGLSWQQSATLLKNSPVGFWLMRDSSDKRYMYAVSVQTARGPTAVRVHYVCGRFRLDAEPRMAPLMPMFECPVKMIEHYIKYSKQMSEHKEVWVDHSGQLYSQIYLTKPLLKEVRSLSHLARLAVNRNNISTKQLPRPIKEYVADYPYTE